MTFRHLGFIAFALSILIATSVQQPLKAQTIPQLESAAMQEIGRVVPNFGMVSPVLLRGGQPKEGGLKRLKSYGVKTIVNLRDGKGDIESERAVAAKLGLNFVSIPMSVFGTASKEQIDKFLSTVRNPENQPVFVHCRQGQDRCGTMVASYRLSEQAWTFKQAYAEMLKYGFHPIFFGLSSSISSLSAGLSRVELQQPKPVIEPSRT